MKIPENDPIQRPEISRPGTKDLREGAEKEASRSDFSTGDKVDISGKTKEIQEMTQKILSSPETRSNRLEEIEHKIASGVFYFEPEKIAVKMLQDTLKNEIL